MKRFSIMMFFAFIFSGVLHAAPITIMYINGVGYAKLPYSSNMWVQINGEAPLQAYEFNKTQMLKKNANANDLSDAKKYPVENVNGVKNKILGKANFASRFFFGPESLLSEHEIWLTMNNSRLYLFELGYPIEVGMSDMSWQDVGIDKNTLNWDELGVDPNTLQLKDPSRITIIMRDKENVTRTYKQDADEADPEKTDIEYLQKNGFRYKLVYANPSSPSVFYNTPYKFDVGKNEMIISNKISSPRTIKNSPKDVVPFGGDQEIPDIGLHNGLKIDGVNYWSILLDGGNELWVKYDKGQPLSLYKLIEGEKPEDHKMAPVTANDPVLSKLKQYDTWLDEKANVTYWLINNYPRVLWLNPNDGTLYTFEAGTMQPLKKWSYLFEKTPGTKDWDAESIKEQLVKIKAGVVKRDIDLLDSGFLDALFGNTSNVFDFKEGIKIINELLKAEPSDQDRDRLNDLKQNASKFVTWPASEVPDAIKIFSTTPVNELPDWYVKYLINQRVLDDVIKSDREAGKQVAYSLMVYLETSKEEYIDYCRRDELKIKLQQIVADTKLNIDEVVAPGLMQDYKHLGFADVGVNLFMGAVEEKNNTRVGNNTVENFIEEFFNSASWHWSTLLEAMTNKAKEDTNNPKAKAEMLNRMLALSVVLTYYVTAKTDFMQRIMPGRDINALSWRAFRFGGEIINEAIKFEYSDGGREIGFKFDKAKGKADKIIEDIKGRDRAY